MRYITNDGEEFVAATPLAFVRELRKLSYTTSTDDKSFMEEVASRAKIQDATANISTQSVESFVDSLISIGWVKPKGD